MLRNLLFFDFTVSDLTLSDLAVPDFTLSEFTSSCAELPFFCPGGQARADTVSNATATAGIQRGENRGDIGSPSAARGWSVLCKVPPTRIHSRRFERRSPSAGAIATRHKGLNAKRVRGSTRGKHKSRTVQAASPHLSPHFACTTLECDLTGPLPGWLKCALKPRSRPELEDRQRASDGGQTQ